MKSATRPGQHRSKDKLIAFDDSELSDWVLTLGEERSGGVLCALAEAVMKADPEDYSVIRPALVNLKRKYAETGSDPGGFADAITTRMGDRDTRRHQHVVQRHRPPDADAGGAPRDQQTGLAFL
jgi:hypothetical protein